MRENHLRKEEEGRKGGYNKEEENGKEEGISPKQ